MNNSEDTKFCEPMILRGALAGPLLRMNNDFATAVGFTEHELASGSLLSWIHPEDRALLEKVLAAGHGHARARHRTKGDGWLPLIFRTRVQDGQISVLGSFNEGSPANLSREEGHYTYTKQSLSSTLTAMVHVVEAKNPGLRCSILLIGEDEEHVMVGAGPSLPDKYNAAVEGLRIGPAVGSCGTAAFWSVPVVVENIAEDPLWKDLRPAAAIAGVASCWSVPVKAMNNNVLGAMALYDVTPAAPTRHQMDMLEMSARMVGLAIERDRLEAQLREATKMEALGVLAGGVAHDFNNLLAAVIGNADLAMMTVGKESPIVHNLDQIVNASITATDLCKQMLAFTGQGVTTVENFDLNNVVQQTGDMLRAAMPKKIGLSFNLSESLLGIQADKSQLRQVIMNLITNASESYGNGTGTIVVGTELHHYTKKELDFFHPDASLKSGQYVRIWVTDNGVGMKPEVVAKIFDPFFSAKSGGRGLGLAAVQGILRAHRGAISVDSTPGEGTTFVVILPHINLDAQEEPFAVRTASPVTARRILICEDDALVRDVLLTATQQAGYDVLEATDGQEAIDVFRSNADAIDCVLLDFNMPKLNGEEVFTELRKIRPDAQVVLCSGFTEHEILSRFEGSGIAGFIPKPVRIDALLTKLAAVMQ